MIELILGDITKVSTDAIVNAANTSLLGGGGVDGAIHRAGGPEVLNACREVVARQGGCKTGEAVITISGKLPARYIIHTVGPVWNGGSKNEEALLAAAYKNSLQLAEENKLESIAFPNISTGIYHFPKQKAAEIAFAVAVEFLSSSKHVKRIVFVCFDEENYRIYSLLLNANIEGLP